MPGTGSVVTYIVIHRYRYSVPTMQKNLLLIIDLEEGKNRADAQSRNSTGPFNSSFQRPNKTNPKINSRAWNLSGKYLDGEFWKHCQWCYIKKKKKPLTAQKESHWSACYKLGFRDLKSELTSIHGQVVHIPLSLSPCSTCGIYMFSVLGLKRQVLSMPCAWKPYMFLLFKEPDSKQLHGTRNWGRGNLGSRKELWKAEAEPRHCSLLLCCLRDYFSPLFLNK